MGESMLSTLDGITDVPSELSVSAGKRSFEFCNDVLVALVDEDVGLSTTSASYTGAALSQLMDSRVSKNSQGGDQLAATANVTKTLKNAVTAGLLGATTGVSFSLDSDYITMFAVREEKQYISGAMLAVSGTLEV